MMPPAQDLWSQAASQPTHCPGESVYSLSPPCPPPELSPSTYRPGSPSVKRTKTEPLVMWAFLPPSLAPTTIWVTLPSSLSPSLPYFTSGSCWTHLQNIQNIQNQVLSLLPRSHLCSPGYHSSFEFRQWLASYLPPASILDALHMIHSPPLSQREFLF